MYCKHCGKLIAQDSKFCQYCGGEIDGVESLHIALIPRKEVVEPSKNNKETVNSEKKERILFKTSKKHQTKDIGTRLLLACSFLALLVFGGLLTYILVNNKISNVRDITIFKVYGPGNIVEQHLMSNDPFFDGKVLSHDIVLYNETGEELAYVGVKFYTNSTDSVDRLEDNGPIMKSFMPNSYICVRKMPKMFEKIPKFIVHAVQDDERSDQFTEHFVLYMKDKDDWLEDPHAE